MLTPKENYLTALVEHKIPEWVPNLFNDVIMAGGGIESFENGPPGGGLDGFGVSWHGTRSAAGQPVPFGKPVLDDITRWEDVVKFPNLDEYDWEGKAAAQLSMPGADRSQKAVEYGIWNAQFLRLTHLMGFENALVAMIEEPEAVEALLSAITDYKIRLVERVVKYYKPDIITSYDDTATERGLFMSPATYRTLIKPQHKRLNDAIKALGAIPFMHTCGKCEAIIPDFIDEGAYAWSAAQPMNDIAGILQKYGDKIGVAGGYNSNGRPGMYNATAEEIEAEVKRCMETYGPYGSYAFMGFRMVASEDPMAFMEAIAPISAAYEKYGRNFYKK